MSIGLLRFICIACDTILSAVELSVASALRGCMCPISLKVFLMMILFFTLIKVPARSASDAEATIGFRTECSTYSGPCGGSKANSGTFSPSYKYPATLFFLFGRDR